MVNSIKTKYVAARRNVGNNMFDVLNEASFVQVDGTWYPVLGYDEFDDILCLENYRGDDRVIHDASLTIAYTDVRVSTPVTKR